jgi:hypothetical protein
VATCLLMSGDSLLLCYTAATDQLRSLLLYDNYSDGLVATNHLPVVIVGYDPLV